MAIFKIYLDETDTWFEVPIVDPTLYLLLDGTRAMTGDLPMGGNAITNVGNVDGVDVSAHASRHTDGSDDIRDATAFGKGLMTDVYAFKLDSIELNADRTDAANVAAAGAAMLVGQAGGQTLKGGTAASEDMTLESTAHGTKGQVVSADNHKFTKGASYDALYDNGNVNGNIVIDWLANGNAQKITLTGNVTQVLFTNPPGPCNCRLWIYQDGTGGRTIADNWDGDVYWGGTAPVVSADADNFDLGVFEYDGASTYAAQLAQGIDGLGFNPPGP